MTKFRRYAAGDKPRFSASQLNAYSDAARAHETSRSTPGKTEVPSQFNATRVPVSNGSGATLAPFSILELSGSSVTPDGNENLYKSQIAFQGKSISEDGTEKFAIVQQFLRTDVIDQGAVVAGVTFALIDGAADKAYATTASGESVLQTGDSGPCVILFDPGPANEPRLAIVRIGSGSGGGECPSWWHLMLLPDSGGFPSSGSFSLDLVVTTSGGNENVSVTVNYNDEVSDLITTLSAESDMLDSSVLIVDVKGGPLHRQAIAIGNKNQDVPYVKSMDWSSNSLDNGQPYLIPWKPTS